MQTQIQEEIIKMQPRGLLTIPKKFRKALTLGEDAFVRIKSDRGRLILEPVRTIDYPVRRYKDEEIEEFFEFDREESKKLRKKGLL